MTDLAALGWDEGWAAAAAAAGVAGVPARISIEHRGAYEAIGERGVVWAELRGKAYAEARDKRALPTVGDWVLVGGEADGVAPIEALLPRRSCLVRAAAGERAEPQPIAANVDVAFVVTSANQDLNPRRIERYLTTVQGGGAQAVIVLNKIDLVDDAAALVARLAAVAPGVAIVAMSAATGAGVEQMRAHVGPGRTAVVVGSSGVGKSTLLNRLLGAAVQEVRDIRARDERGVHTTTRRELFLLEGGGVLIDTPGMRELKPWTDRDEIVFDDVEAIAQGCRFGDCLHEAEPGCAVREAVARGELAADRVAAWQKLWREQRSEATRRARTPRKGRKPRPEPG